MKTTFRLVTLSFAILFGTAVLNTTNAQAQKKNWDRIEDK